MVSVAIPVITPLLKVASVTKFSVLLVNLSVVPSVSILRELTAVGIPAFVSTTNGFAPKLRLVTILRLRVAVLPRRRSAHWSKPTTQLLAVLMVSSRVVVLLILLLVAPNVITHQSVAVTTIKPSVLMALDSVVKVAITPPRHTVLILPLSV